LPQLFDGYFMWEKQRGTAVAKPHQIHMAAEIIDLADDARVLFEAAQPLPIPNWPQQSAMSPANRFHVCSFHDCLSSDRCAVLAGLPADQENLLWFRPYSPANL
jgi:hypothetical protein